MITSMNRLNIHDPAVFSEALRTIYRADCKRSRSARPINRAEKMTLKNIYQNKRICASFDNNLPRAIRDDVQNFIVNLKREGYIMRRLPSININPKDLQKIRKIKKDKKQALNQLGEYFEI